MQKVYFSFGTGHKSQNGVDVMQTSTFSYPFLQGSILVEVGFAFLTEC